MDATQDCLASRQQRLRQLPYLVATASLVLIFLIGALPAARADIDNAELMAKTSLKDRKAQDDYRKRIADDLAAEAQRAAELAREAEREAAAQRAAEEARPWPVRLTERRCTECHVANNFSENGHTVVGWWTVALRMRFVNGAAIPWSELSIIVPHLSEIYPARGSDKLIEWGVFFFILAALPAAVISGYWLWKRKST